MEKLDPEFKERWTAALRSGEYKQGKDYLAQIEGNSTTYCCLGVAAKLCHIDDHIMLDLDAGIPADLGDERLETHGYPKILRDVSAQAPAGVLADMNDTGSSFNELADWIEVNL